MRNLSSQLLENTYAAPALVFAASLGGVWLPVSWVGLIVIAWLTLGRGAKHGLTLLAWYALPAITLGLSHQTAPAIDLSLAQACALWAIASVDRLYQKLAYSLILLFLFGLAGLTVFYLAVPNPDSFWLTQLKTLQALTPPTQLSAAEFNRILLQLAPFVTALLTASLSLFTLFYFAVASWWMSLLHPDSTSLNRFRSLRLSSVYLIPVACTGLAYAAQPYMHNTSFAHAVLILALCPFMLTGLSLVHRIVHQKNQKNGAWRMLLWFTYAALFFLSPITEILLALLSLLTLKQQQPEQAKQANTPNLS